MKHLDVMKIATILHHIHKSHEETPVLIIATGKGAKKAEKTWGKVLGVGKA